jgi:hypothetical protein
METASDSDTSTEHLYMAMAKDNTFTRPLTGAAHSKVAAVFSSRIRIDPRKKPMSDFNMIFWAGSTVLHAHGAGSVSGQRVAKMWAYGMKYGGGVGTGANTGRVGGGGRGSYIWDSSIRCATFQEGSGFFLQKQNQ